jgi:hypothetical protein
MDHLTIANTHGIVVTIGGKVNPFVGMFKSFALILHAYDIFTLSSNSVSTPALPITVKMFYSSIVATR